jgi:hypothetical protein
MNFPRTSRGDFFPVPTNPHAGRTTRQQNLVLFLHFLEYPFFFLSVFRWMYIVVSFPPLSVAPFLLEFLNVYIFDYELT